VVACGRASRSGGPNRGRDGDWSLDGLKARQEDFFPDPTGQQIGEQHLSDPNALERVNASQDSSINH
jgi:hypothetical protein